ncbi:B12-binding domain-containing radical SAM protein [Chlamydiota bacterium]
MKNILLINPWESEILPPPALGYLHSFIQNNCKDTNVIMINSDEIDLIHTQKIDLIGITVNSFSVPALPNLLNKLKNLFPEARFIAGGHHVTSLPDQILNLGFDQVVLGPGEKAFIDIINGNEEKKIYGSLPELDSIPFPDYHGLSGSWELPLYEGGTALPIISSRGCPFKCKFCASSQFWQRKWYPRSPENVVAEILENLETGKMRYWMFSDDNFTLDRKRALRICQLLEENICKKYPVRWHAASRAESLADKELCEAMAHAGCSCVWLGIESGSPNILSLCGKDTSTEKMLKGIAIADSCGISTVGQFIIGLPGETMDTVKETKAFIQKSKIKITGFNKPWVLPGTYLYDYSVEKQGIDENIFLKGVPFYTAENSEKVLDDWIGELKTLGRHWPEASFMVRVKGKMQKLKKLFINNFKRR